MQFPLFCEGLFFAHNCFFCLSVWKTRLNCKFTSIIIRMLYIIAFLRKGTDSNPNRAPSSLLLQPTQIYSITCIQVSIISLQGPQFQQHESKDTPKESLCFETLALSRAAVLSSQDPCVHPRVICDHGHVVLLNGSALGWRTLPESIGHLQGLRRRRRSGVSGLSGARSGRAEANWGEVGHISCGRKSSKNEGIMWWSR